MAKLKLVIDSSKVLKSGECVVLVQLSAHNKTIRVSTEIKVRPEWWKNSQVTTGRKGDELAQIKNINLNQILHNCSLKIINNPDRVKSMDVQALKKFLFSSGGELSTDFYIYTKSRIDHYSKLGKKSSVKLFSAMSSKIQDFRGEGKSLPLDEIDISFLELFENYCYRTMKVNGAAVYLRYLRIVLNDAIDDKLITDYPFRKFKIRTEKTKNRNLSIEVVRKIRDYQTQVKREQFARDVFMMQIYLFGLNIIDLFYLKPSNIVGDRLQFKRTKTGRECNIKLEPEAKRLLEAYKGQKYLLWFADNCMDERKPGNRPHMRATMYQWADQEAFNRMINENLQKIHDNLNLSLPIPLTSYASRHTFATVMYQIGVEKDVISMALSHSDPEQNLKTTGIYLNLDYERCDKANRKLIDHVNEDKKEVIDYSI